MNGRLRAVTRLTSAVGRVCRERDTRNLSPCQNPWAFVARSSLVTIARGKRASPACPGFDELASQDAGSPSVFRALNGAAVDA